VIVSPSLQLNYLSEIFQARGRIAADIERYTGEENLDTEDLLGTFSGLYRASELSTWRLRATYKRESVLKVTPLAEIQDVQSQPETELPVKDPIDIDAPVDVGVIEQQLDRDTFLLSPSWTRLLTERSRLSLGYRFRSVSYESAPGLNLIDSDSHQGTATFGYLLTERDELTGTVRFTTTQFDTQPDERTTDEWELTAGINHAFTETLEGALSGGVRFTSFDGDVQDDNETGSVVRALLRQRTEITILEGRLEREVVPTSGGELGELDRFVLFVDRRFSPRLSATLLAEVFQEDTLGGRETSSDRWYYRLNPALRWRWTPDLTLELAYRFVHNAPEIEESATSNAALLTLTYRWPPISLSR
jgi:hypothetical protein